MIKIEKVEVQGFDAAIRGMRNPKNSWNRSDSGIIDNYGLEHFEVGDKDLKLMKTLFKAGTEHRKYDRMVQVWMDITAPLYWWKEFDTYKVGTVANGTSTMHKIHSKEFTVNDFSHEHLDANGLQMLQDVVTNLNDSRNLYNNGSSEYGLPKQNKLMWWQMIQLLPSSYNQKRTVMMNYEVCARIIEQRSNHKLDEWKQLVQVLRELPYMDELIGVLQESKKNEN